MTPEQLAALKETIRGTTPGSRKVVVTKGSVSLYASDENCRIYRTELDPECLKQTHDRQIADAWFHAKFNPTRCLELLEEVERLRLRVEEQICSSCASDLQDGPCDPVCTCTHPKHQHIRPGEGADYEDCAAEDDCPCLKFQEQP
jgi:hypothetical protein